MKNIAPWNDIHRVGYKRVPYDGGHSTPLTKQLETMETLNDALAATEEVRSLDAFQWIEDKADKLDDGLYEFEGNIPGHMKREIEAKMVEVGFDRSMNGRVSDKYFTYNLPTEDGDIKVNVYDSKIQVRIKTDEYTPRWEQEDDEDEYTGRFRS